MSHRALSAEQFHGMMGSCPTCGGPSQRDNPTYFRHEPDCPEVPHDDFSDPEIDQMIENLGKK